MRKMAMIVGMLLVSTTCVFAMPERTQKTDMGFQIGGLSPSAAHIDTGVYYGLNAAYGINDWFAVGVEGGYEDTKTRFTIGTNEHNPGLSYIPLFADLIVRHSMVEYGAVPYGVLGLGMLFMNDHGTGTLNDSHLKLETDNSFAIKLGAGVDWFINEKWALNFEASYVWAAADAKIVDLTTSDTVDSASLNYWTILGGLKYLFD